MFSTPLVMKLTIQTLSGIQSSLSPTLGYAVMQLPVPLPAHDYGCDA